MFRQLKLRNTKVNNIWGSQEQVFLKNRYYNSIHSNKCLLYMNLSSLIICLTHKSNEENLESSKKWEKIKIQIKHKRKYCICIIFHTLAGSKITEKNIHLILEEIIKLIYAAPGFTLISYNMWIWILILSVLISQYIKNVY